MQLETSLDAEPEVFFDPNTLSEDGTVALSTSSFSEDGELFAYALSESGSDWMTIKVCCLYGSKVYPNIPRKISMMCKVNCILCHNTTGFLVFL